MLTTGNMPFIAIKEGTVLRCIASDADDATLLSYLQGEFAARGLTVPRRVASHLDEIAARAEDTALSLLEEGRSR